MINFFNITLFICCAFSNDINNLPTNNYGVHLYNEIWRNNKDINKSYNYDEYCLYEELKRKYNVKSISNNKISFDILLENNNIKFKIDLNKS